MDKSDKMEKAKNFIVSIKKDKKRLTMIILAALGILLLLVSAPSSKSGGSEAETADSLSEYKKNLEAELSELCSSVKGAGRCRVKVSFSEGERAEYRGSNKIAETPPRVLGITVVAEGADRADVKAALTECMCAMFDIGANRVAVLEMKN